MKKKLLSSLLVGALVFGLVACVGSDLPGGQTTVPNTTEAPGTEGTEAPGTTDGTVGETEETSGETTESETPPQEYDLADNLKINFASGNNQRTITYQQATPLQMPDGTVISQGELKPVWQELENRLGFSIEDVTIQDQSAVEMMDISASTNFSNANIYGGNSVAESFMSFGAQGYFVPLSDYADQLPNFNRYLDENPDIKTSITAYDGAIYFVPYVAEIGNYARMYHARQSWITSLLDSDQDLETEDVTLNVAYEGFWDRNDSNVVTLQNEAAEGGALTGSVALETLLNYISETYPDLANPSDLYLGSDAQYDIDELVALLRVVKLHPNTLTKVTTGSVVPNAQISPYFVRQSSYREELLRLANYFEGQHVHGSDSYGSRFYLDAEGELQYSYSEDKFLEIVDSLEDLFSEGLVHSEFSDLTLKDNFRNMLFSQDEVEGQTQFGFLTFDWTASTTAANDDVVGILPPVTTMASSNGEFVHYVENTRVVKPDGWAISTQSTEEEINAALALFDYFFTEEGHTLQNYGVEGAIAEGELYTGPDNIEYPKFSPWVMEQSEELKNGDVSAFLRDFVGALIPIGYQKEIGFEYQYTTENGMATWNTYNEAGVLMPTYTETNPELKLVPPVFSLTEQDLARINNTAISTDQVDMIFQFITGSGEVTSIDQIKEAFQTADIDTYINVYRQAYQRMSE